MVTNEHVSLFKHVLDYEGKLNEFLDKAGGWIREQEECIWTIDVSNNGGHWSVIMCQPRYFVPSPGNTPLISSKPCIPEPVSNHLRVRARSLCSPLVRASQLESSSHSVFWQPQEGRGHFEGGYHLQYRRQCSLLQWGQVCPLPHPQHPHRSQEMPKHSCWVVFPPVLSLQYALLPIADVPSPLLHNTCSLASSSNENLASEHRSRVSRSSSSSSSGLGSGSGSGSESQGGFPARSEASAGARSVHSASSVGWKCWSPLWRWSQWRQGWYLGLCKWGRCVPRQYVPAWHLHHRRWRYPQMQSTWACP